ncbi:PIG-L deacetylase family protein [Archangium lansingense]|uniref:PIG-L family deacetylase n=1 Tax=Archangium lansingense TaxID=2995310 RepID=A0ABT3ZX69_9BACT|nr:PIG-L family deacetylase [Archangium lansinium]MCY1073994.1 PIG-L family deacetylase [Archangium lansinium]
MRPPDESASEDKHLGGDGRTIGDILAPLLPPQALRGSLLFLAAHPDDEVLGASWLLRRSPGCHVVHVTDGAPIDAALRTLDAPPTREAYARIREEESLAALALAGVPRDNLLSLGAVDQESAQQLVTLTECLVALIKALRPALLVVPAYEGGHPDHDSAAFISHAAVALLARTGRTPPVLLEMASYCRHREGLVIVDFLAAPDGRPVATVTFTEAECAAKRRMLACYASQTRTLDTFPVREERYRAAPRYDFTRPPHEGTLPYESRGWRMTGARWRELAREALEALKLPEAPWH